MRGYDKAIFVLNSNIIINAMTAGRYEKCIVLLFTILIIACTNRYSANDLYGTWIAHDSMGEINITFNQDSTFEYVCNETTSTIIKITGKYEVDFTKQPIPLTIRKIPQLNHPLYTIIEFKRLDVLKMAEFAPRWRIRPISFKPNSEIILSRSNTHP